MNEEDDEQCFRCGASRKIMINMRIDDNPVCLCANCYRDLTLFFEGYVLNLRVKMQYGRKENDTDE